MYIPYIVAAFVHIRHTYLYACSYFYSILFYSIPSGWIYFQHALKFTVILGDKPDNFPHFIAFRYVPATTSKVTFEKYARDRIDQIKFYIFRSIIYVLYQRNHANLPLLKMTFNGQMFLKNLQNKILLNVLLYLYTPNAINRWPQLVYCRLAGYAKTTVRSKTCPSNGIQFKFGIERSLRVK